MQSLLKRHGSRIIVALAVSGAGAGVVGLAGAASAAGPPSDLSWHSVDGGGGTSTAASFVLAGAIGQPDASVSTGGGFELVGGFFAGSGGGGGTPCPADFDGDGGVDFDDLLSVLSDWGPCEGACPEDLDGSGAVDFPDLLSVLAAYGPCPG